MVRGLAERQSASDEFALFFSLSANDRVSKGDQTTVIFSDLAFCTSILDIYDSGCVQ